MVLDDALTDGEADAGAVLPSGFRAAFEQAEDAVVVFGGDADAVVGDGEQPVAVAGLDADFDDWFLAAVVEGVADQVLEELREENAVAVDGRQRGLQVHMGAGVVNGDLESGEGLFEALLAGGDLIAAALAGGGEAQDAADEGLHAAGAFDEVANPAVGFLGELAVITAFEELGVLIDDAEGFLEVVRDDGGEVVELGVGAFELGEGLALGSDIEEDAGEAAGLDTDNGIADPERRAGIAGEAIFNGGGGGIGELAADGVQGGGAVLFMNVSRPGRVGGESAEPDGERMGKRQKGKADLAEFSVAFPEHETGVARQMREAREVGVSVAVPEQEQTRSAEDQNGGDRVDPPEFGHEWCCGLRPRLLYFC